MFSMKKTCRTLAAAATVSVLGISSALANPTAVVTVQNNFSDTATFSSPAGCAATSYSFPNLTAGNTTTVSLQSTSSSAHSCSIQYMKSGSSAGCRFVVSRFTTFSLGVFRWGAPQVNVTRYGGAHCTYTLTSFPDIGEIPNGSNGGFSVTLTVDE